MKTKKPKRQTVARKSDSPVKPGATSWPKPRWEEWLQSTRLRLWQAVALSCDLRPHKIAADLRKTAPDRYDEYRVRLRVALRNLGEGLHPVEAMPDDRSHCWIRLAAFRAWAVGMRWKLPNEFVCAEPDKSPDWPWGKYTTELLDHLAAAVRAKWMSFDKAHPDTAPLREEVEAFLMARGVLPRNAGYIARIIHSDYAPKGRPTDERKRSSLNRTKP